MERAGNGLPMVGRGEGDSEAVQLIYFVYLVYFVL